MSGIGKHLNQAHLQINLDPVVEWLASYHRSMLCDPVTSFFLSQTTE